MRKLALAILFFTITAVAAAQEQSLAEYLQSISVTIKSGTSQGSGTIITREIKPEKDSQDTKTISFVFTAAHVIDNLKQTRKVINPRSGSEQTVVEFKDATVCQFMVEDGRKVGSVELAARPIRYSDPDDGEDLAVLMLLKRDFTDKSAKFYLDDNELELLTPVIHCGSFSGEFGHNSLSSGEISAIGRMLETGRGAGKPFTQISNAAFPGSSGGLVVLREDARYVGMLTRGVDTGFTFIIPMSRIKKWTKEVGMEWLINESMEPPTLEEILDSPVDDAANLFPVKISSESIEVSKD